MEYVLIMVEIMLYKSPFIPCNIQEVDKIKIYNGLQKNNRGDQGTDVFLLLYCPTNTECSNYKTKEEQ